MTPPRRIASSDQPRATMVLILLALRIRQRSLADGKCSSGAQHSRREAPRGNAATSTSYASGVSVDANGNQVATAAGATYAWDFENRLSSVVTGDGTLVQHVYDVDGNRVQTSVTPVASATTATGYLVDRSGGLSHVVAETNASGAATALYVRGGNQLLAVLRAAGAKYFHADGLGSVRALTDGDGVASDSYAYSAFGEGLSSTAGDAQPYRFAGEAFEPASGFQYHRARWLSTQSGRFVSADPFRGYSSLPVSLHRYLYAGCGPIQNADPSGRDFTNLADVSAFSSVLESLQGIRIGNVRFLQREDGWAPDSEQLEDDPEVSAWIEDAWQRSLPNEPAVAHEEGGLIYFNRQTWAYLMMPRHGSDSYPSISMLPLERVPGYYLVGTFHTHPYFREWESIYRSRYNLPPNYRFAWDGASFDDEKAATNRGVPDLVRVGDGSIDVAGPSRRQNLALERPSWL